MAGKPATRSKASETKLVRELAEILTDTDLTEIEMRKGDLKIRVSRGGGKVVQAATVMAAAPSAAPTPPAPSAAAPSTAPTEDAASHPGAVKSPMVGTAYIRPSPDADPFVSVGGSVKEGDTVMLIEAMKTFNPITASKSGKIVKVLVEDAQPVEFGEPLFIIE